MRALLIHALWLYEHLLGNLRPDAAEDEVLRAARYAEERSLVAVAALSVGMDRVLVAVDSGPSFRREIDKATTETQRERPKAVWVGYRRLVAQVDEEAVVYPPTWPAGAPFVDLGNGDALPLAGLRPSARDVIATIAGWWRERHVEGYLEGAPTDGHPADCLRIASGRRTLAHLAAAGAGIELVRDVRPDGSYTVSTESDLAEGRSELLADIKALVLLGDWHKAATQGKRSVLGEDAARKLVEAHQGSALRAVEMAALAAAGHRLPGVAAPTMAVLRAAAANDFATVRRALAVATVRSDVAIDVAALLAPEGERDGARTEDVAGVFRGGANGREDARGAQGGSAIRSGGHAPPPRMEADVGGGVRLADGGAGGDVHGALAPGDGDLPDPRPVRAPGRAGDHVDPSAPLTPVAALLLETASACESYAPGAATELRRIVGDPGSLACVTSPEHRVRDLLRTYTPWTPGGLDGWGKLPVGLRAALSPPTVAPCAHARIVDLPGGDWARCTTCGDPSFPVSEAAANGTAPAYGAPTPQPAPAAPPSQTRTIERTETMPPSDQPETADTDESYISHNEPRAAAPLAIRQEAAPVVREAARTPPAALTKPAPEPPAMMSIETDALFRALYKAQMAFEEVKKTRPMKVGNTVRYHYANLSDVVGAVMPALKANGFACTHICRGNRLHVRLIHVDSGQWIEGVLPFVAPTVNGPEGVQALGSLLTYLRRYLLTMLLGVVAVDDDDDDGTAAQGSGRAA